MSNVYEVFKNNIDKISELIKEKEKEVKFKYDIMFGIIGGHDVYEDLKKENPIENNLLRSEEQESTLHIIVINREKRKKEPLKNILTDEDKLDGHSRFNCLLKEVDKAIEFINNLEFDKSPRYKTKYILKHLHGEDIPQGTESTSTNYCSATNCWEVIFKFNDIDITFKIDETNKHYFEEIK